MTRIQQAHSKQAWHFSKTMWCTLTLFSLVDQKSYEIHYSWVASSSTPPPPPPPPPPWCAFEEESMFFWEILLILVGWWWPYLLLHKSSTSISHLRNKEFPSNPLPSHIKLKLKKKKKKKSQSRQRAFDRLPILRCTQAHIFKCLNLYAALDQTWPTGLPLVTLSWLHPLWQVQTSVSLVGPAPRPPPPANLV